MYACLALHLPPIKSNEMLTPSTAVGSQMPDSLAAPSSLPCRCRCDRMCFRVSSSCVSCPILSCSFWFSSCSCMALCWVSRILLRALSLLFLTAMLFLSRLRRYSTLSLLMLLLVTGALRVGSRKVEKS